MPSKPLLWVTNGKRGSSVYLGHLTGVKMRAARETSWWSKAKLKAADMRGVYCSDTKKNRAELEIVRSIWRKGYVWRRTDDGMEKVEKVTIS